MKVLVASKFWYLRGGLERVMFSEVRALEDAGFKVAHFSTTHPANESSPWSGYFAPYLELGAAGGLGARESAKAALRMFSNRAAAGAFGRLLEDFRPDIVHVHGIHRQLSPSILLEAESRGVPVVQSLHDAHHVCPADVLLRGGAQVCSPRKCGTLNYLPAVAYRCVRGSAGASALSAAETVFQRARRVYERTVNRFVVPSRYLAGVMEEGGWRTIPLDVVPNGVSSVAERAQGDRDYFLFAGRLSPEKGVDVALRAAAQCGQRIIIAGDGPLKATLEAEFPQFEFTGHVDSDEMARLLDGAIASIVTSVVPENSPMAVLEAMARAVPVIASNLGGVPELVTSAHGVLVDAGDVTGVAAAMDQLAGDAVASGLMGQAGRIAILDAYTLEAHMHQLLDVYDRAVVDAKGTR